MRERDKLGSEGELCNFEKKAEQICWLNAHAYVYVCARAS